MPVQWSTYNTTASFLQPDKFFSTSPVIHSRIPDRFRIYLVEINDATETSVYGGPQDNASPIVVYCWPLIGNTVLNIIQIS